jgi:hypothetical protein
MQQLKIFTALESDTAMLERTVNHWMATANVRVLQISGNIAPQTETGRPGGLSSAGSSSDVVLFVLYEPLSAATAKT